MKLSVVTAFALATLVGLIFGTVTGYQLRKNFSAAAKSAPETATISSVPVRVYFSGEVHQGALTLPEGRPLTLSQAIIIDGGLQAMANTRRVHIQRMQPDHSFVRIDCDYAAALQGDFSHDPTLRSGDIIVVPERVLNF